jgi:hypothetical protein
MTVKLTAERCQDIVTLCSHLLQTKRVTFREFAKIIGKLVAAEPGVEYAPLYYKPLEKIKEIELKRHRGNFDSYMTIPHGLYDTLQWWIDNLPKTHKLVSHGPPELVLYSDASGTGWGAHNATTNVKTGGQWSADEQALHINVLELKACQLTLLCFCQTIKNKHVRIYTDNTTSCAYINKFGGKKHELNQLAREIWIWCLRNNIHLTAAHVRGAENIEADKQSRIINDDLEWSLSSNVFRDIQEKYPKLSVDLFASRLNNKFTNYVSRRPDPEAMAIDAFTLTWSKSFYYIFPPFSLINKILQKLEEDHGEAVLVAPIWPTQTWWPSLLRMITGTCYKLPNPQKILYLPQKPDKIHPLKKMKLGVFPISGRPWQTKESTDQLETSSLNHGDSAQRSSTTRTSHSGWISVHRTLTPFNPH